VTGRENTKLDRRKRERHVVEESLGAWRWVGEEEKHKRQNVEGGGGRVTFFYRYC